MILAFAIRRFIASVPEDSKSREIFAADFFNKSDGSEIFLF